MQITMMINFHLLTEIEWIFPMAIGPETLKEDFIFDRPARPVMIHVF